MEQSPNIVILPAFGDNYIYLAEYAPGRCFAVDPGDAGTVADALVRRNLKLTHILVTHHHADHIGGVDTLKRKTGCTVVGSDPKRIRGLDTVMKDGDKIELADVQVNCIATPGHTATSVCFFVSGGGFAAGILFSGDTLFVCGCGRMFECDGETMYQSLQKLTALQDETLIFPGHDYTEENVEFALTVHPADAALKEKLEQVILSSASGQPTVPSTLGEEKKLNPFLTAADWKTFATLRRKKDVF